MHSPSSDSADDLVFTISRPDVREVTIRRDQPQSQARQPRQQQQPAPQQPNDPDNNDRRRDEDGNIEFDCD